jgi:hypothetical protein
LSGPQRQDSIRHHGDRLPQRIERVAPGSIMSELDEQSRFDPNPDQRQKIQMQIVCSTPGLIDILLDRLQAA